MNSPKLQELSERARKYLQTGSDRSKFNVESLKSIENEIDVSVSHISKEEIEEFFDFYMEAPFGEYVSKKHSKEAIYSFLNPYLLKDSSVKRELQETKKIKKEVQQIREQDEKLLHKYENRLFGKYFYRDKISKLKDSIDYEAIILSKVNQAELRRKRWGVDMLIGDFYVIYRVCLYLLYTAKKKKLDYLEENVTKAVKNLIQTIDNSIMDYPYRKRKDIKEHIVSMLENISQSKLNEVTIKIDKKASNNIIKSA